MSEAAEFDGSLRDLESALRAAIRAYAQWHAKEWGMTREDWLKAFRDPPPNGDYFDGYTAGIESTLASVETFLDERIG